MPDIRTLSAPEARAAIRQLSALFSQTVEAGASMGFMSPFSPDEASTYWSGVAEAVENGAILLLTAWNGENIVGSVQLAVGTPPNQPHRADLKKLMVLPAARGRGISRTLMEAAERAAIEAGRDLLVLDTATGEPAEAIYQHFGWTRVGTIPRYALFPDGRECATTLYYKDLRQIPEFN